MEEEEEKVEVLPFPLPTSHSRIAWYEMPHTEKQGPDLSCKPVFITFGELWYWLKDIKMSISSQVRSVLFVVLATKMATWVGTIAVVGYSSEKTDPPNTQSVGKREKERKRAGKGGKRSWMTWNAHCSSLMAPLESKQCWRCENIRRSKDVLTDRKPNGHAMGKSMADKGRKKRLVSHEIRLAMN